LILLSDARFSFDSTEGHHAPPDTTMIQHLCVDECVRATGKMSTKAKKIANRLTVLFVNSNKLAPGLYDDGNNLLLSVR